MVSVVSKNGRRMPLTVMVSRSFSSLSYIMIAQPPHEPPQSRASLSFGNCLLINVFDMHVVAKSSIDVYVWQMMIQSLPYTCHCCRDLIQTDLKNTVLHTRFPWPIVYTMSIYIHRSSCSLSAEASYNCVVNCKLTIYTLRHMNQYKKKLALFLELREHWLLAQRQLCTVCSRCHSALNVKTAPI